MDEHNKQIKQLDKDAEQWCGDLSKRNRGGLGLEAYHVNLIVFQIQTFISSSNIFNLFIFYTIHIS